MPATPPEPPASPWAHLVDAVLATPPEQQEGTYIDGELALARALSDYGLNPYPWNYQGLARRILTRMAHYLPSREAPF